jgi:hypothetical protein
MDVVELFSNLLASVCFSVRSTQVTELAFVGVCIYSGERNVRVPRTSGRGTRVPRIPKQGSVAHA